MTSKLVVSAVVVVVILACSCSLAQLTVVPLAVAVEPTWTAQFSCSPENGSEADRVTWTFNQTVLPRGPRESVENGVLTIVNATYSDAGMYTCSLGNDTSDGTLIVYDMPDYIAEAIVIGSICLGLLVILVTGVVIIYVKQEKERRKRHKARREKAERRTNRYADRFCDTLPIRRIYCDYKVKGVKESNNSPRFCFSNIDWTCIFFKSVTSCCYYIIKKNNLI
ncbi:hypothetical protein Btru_023179 [Bulinus truncatus]|nr:hypothetical protein Btru_023179 [Bulinus truncatus]